MRQLVTGGAGFIGSNYIYQTLANHPEDEIICLDMLTYAGNLCTLQGALNHPNFKFIRGDISDPAAVEDVFSVEKPDVVINFAAESHVDRSIGSPSIFTQTNILGTQVLMDASLRYGIKRFHQVSTDEVYGDLPLDDTESAFKEDAPLKPSSPYAASKASADLLALSYLRTYGLPLTISRCTNNYGPYQHPEKLIPLMITHLREGIALPVYGKGLNIRDWLHVSDHCRAIDEILRKGQPGRVYNIGGNNPMGNLEVVRAIIAAVGASEDSITFVTDRAGHDLRYAVDSSRIKEELSWTPRIPFDSGLLETISWYHGHLDWCKEVLEDVAQSNLGQDAGGRS